MTSSNLPVESDLHPDIPPCRFVLLLRDFLLAEDVPAIDSLGLRFSFESFDAVK